MQGTIPVMEHFATIQGEGQFSGVPAYFIRTGGCDVGCHWCDVKESWPAEGHSRMTPSEIAAYVVASGIKTAVVTGGEPAMHDLSGLTEQLQKHNIRTHIETSGTHPLTGQWDWITFSPKKFKSPLEGFAGIASELKVIVFNSSDFAFAEIHAAQVAPECALFLQPEWDRRERMIPEMVDYVKTNPKWRISLQSHKYMNIP